ncbi:MAG: alanine/ornithine racemase family PLP-dependent enzyme [Vicingaceae bacterium]
MAFITLDQHKLEHNFRFLQNLFDEHGIRWTIVSKLLCGYKPYLQVLHDLGAENLCDSRIANLRTIKSVSKDIETVFIKPPAKRNVKNVVKYADISFNTEIETIKALSEEAVRQNKKHQVLIMIELGELREGVLKEEFLDFYEAVFQLPNIEVIGIGTNLTCMYGVLPTHDKLIQLCLYVNLIESKFNRVIPFISGGTTVTIPLIFQNLLPKGVNHFRIGEALFQGTEPYHNEQIEGMKLNLFELNAEIIELTEKPRVPDGKIVANVKGESMKFDEEDKDSTSLRALIDLGVLDVDEDQLKLIDDDISIVGSSSDVMVIDLGTNKKNYKVGDYISFNLGYLAILRVMNSRYIEKKIKIGNKILSAEPVLN